MAYRRQVLAKELQDETARREKALVETSIALTQNPQSRLEGLRALRDIAKPKGQTSDEFIGADRAVQVQEREMSLAAEKSALDDKLALAQDNAQERIKVLREVAEFERKTNGELSDSYRTASRAVRTAEREDLRARLEGFASFAKTASSSLEGLAAGTKSIGAVLKDVLSQSLDLLLDFVTKQIMAQALATGAGSAAAVAPTPFVGPFLAIGAMTAGVALVKGLLSQLPSAYGGADWAGVRGSIDSRGGFLTVTHPGELTIPQNLSDRVRNWTEPQASSAVNIHLSLTAMDGKSAKQWMLGEGSEAIIAAVQQAQQRRRI
jgi:hypothetical protein